MPYFGPVKCQPQMFVYSGPILKAKNSCVQANLENLIMSEQRSKPQVVQSYF